MVVILKAILCAINITKEVIRLFGGVVQIHTAAFGANTAAVIVTGGLNRLGIAVGTGAAGILACTIGGTGSFLCHGGRIAVTGGLNGFRVAVAALGAGIGTLTGSGTGGCCGGLGGVAMGTATGGFVVIPGAICGAVHIGSHNTIVVLDQSLVDGLVSGIVTKDHMGSRTGNGYRVNIVAHRGHLHAGPIAAVGISPSTHGGPGISVNLIPLGRGIIKVDGGVAGSRLRQIAVVAVAIDKVMGNLLAAIPAQTALVVVTAGAAIALLVVHGFLVDQIAQNQNRSRNTFHTNVAVAGGPHGIDTGIHTVDTGLPVAIRHTIIIDVHPLGVLIGIEDDDDTIGALIVGISADIEHDTLIIDLVVAGVVPGIGSSGTAQRRMVLTELNQSAVIIVGDLSIVLIHQIRPSDLCGIVIGIIAVVLTITVLVHLLTKQLFTGIDEGNALRQHINSGRQVIHFYHLIPISTVTGDDDLIHQRVVIVAGNIVDALGRTAGPPIACPEVFSNRISLAGSTGGKAQGLTVIAGNLITEGVVVEAHAAYLVGIFLTGQRVIILHSSVTAAGPAFAVEDDVGVLCLNGADNLIDGLGINQTCQVKPEAVNVIFLSPVHNGVHNVVTAHAALGGKVIAAAGTVGPVIFTPEPGEVIGNNLVVAEVTAAVGVVVNHVHNHVDTIVVEGLDHLLGFCNTDRTVIRIC